MKLFKKILCLMCTMALLVTAVPSVLAEGLPSLYFSNPTLTAGSRSSVALYMSGATDVSAMDYIITYDAENLEYDGYYKTGFTNRSDVTFSVNCEEPGIIHVTLVSQEGLTGSTGLNGLYFKAKATAKAGTYPINVLVNDMYNSNLETVEATTTAGTITVREPTQTVKSASFGNWLSTYSITVGESVNYNLKAHNVTGLSAGTFDFTYDETKLKFEKLTFTYNGMQNAVYDLNSDRDGLVKLSFVTDNPIETYRDIICVKFTAIDSGNTSIGFAPSDLYDNEFVPMVASNLTSSITIKEPEIEVDYPDFKFSIPESVPSDREFSVTAVLEGGSGLRAGDFVVNYDVNALECLGISGETISGAWLSIDKNYSGGVARFSLMSNVDLTNDTALVTMKFKAKQNVDLKTSLTASGTDTYDVDFGAVSLEYKQSQINVKRPEYTVNFYDADGTSLIDTQKVMSGNSAIPPEAEEIKKLDTTNHLKFSGWNKEYSVILDNIDIVAVYKNEAHAVITQSAVGATCTGTGLTEGKYCVVCDTVLVAQKVVPAKGHTQVATPEIKPGVETPGYKGGTHCSVCGDVIIEPEMVSPTGAVITAEVDMYGVLAVDGKLSDNASTNGKTLIAVYDGTGKLLHSLDITGLNQAGFKTSILNCYDASYIKIVRWDMSSLEPLCSAVKTNVVKNTTINAKLINDNLTVSGTLPDAAVASGTVYVAVYNAGGRMVALQNITGLNQAGFETVISNCYNASYIKIVRWDMTSLKPICGVIKVNVD